MFHFLFDEFITYLEQSQVLDVDCTRITISGR
ncbi:hypothetical protein O166_21655 [Pseudogulbenkiania ferrooxidans EGD-HP2]|uniref:Transposase n=1 Tax=Pseudogulbenkiania ferrooxidans EGD-HP2 TaxID=1388764 RepID=A0ABP2XQQ8_9NEIS|nr:hypothetical protein O166_21655 [Pseudogulbenkiania ferrooxidans EGD-HP2]